MKQTAALLGIFIFLLPISHWVIENTNNSFMNFMFIFLVAVVFTVAVEELRG